MMKIRLTQDTLVKGEHYDAGDTITVGDPLARMLIGINRAVAVDDTNAIETAVVSDESEKAIQKRKRKSEVE